MIKKFVRLLILPFLLVGTLLPYGVTYAAPDQCQYDAFNGVNLRANGIKNNANYSGNDPFVGPANPGVRNCEHGTGGLQTSGTSVSGDILSHPNAVQFNMFRDNTYWGLLKKQVSGATTQAVINNANNSGRLDHLDEREFLAVQTPINNALPAGHSLSGTLQAGDQIRLYMLVHNNAQQVCGAAPGTAAGNAAENVQVSVDWDDVSGQIVGQIQADNMFLPGSGVGTNSIFDQVTNINLAPGLVLEKAGPVRVERQNNPNDFYCNGNNITHVTEVEGVDFGGTVTYDTDGSRITVNLGNINGSNGNIRYVYIDLNVVFPDINVIKDDNVDFNDTQTLNEGDTAQFWVQVFSSGTSDLKDVYVTDLESPRCSLTTSQVEYILTNGASGTNPTQLLSFDRGLTLNTNTILESGEGFRYACDIDNVLTNTFLDNHNDIEAFGTSVTGDIDVSDDDPTEVLVTSSASINIIKDDNDNNDDTQNVREGETAEFSVVVVNNGTALLNNVRITDDEAPNCDRDDAQTQALIQGVGNGDAIFNPGEFFTYTCIAQNVQVDTFMDDDNDILVEASPVSGGVDVSGGDFSFVRVPSIDIDKDDNDNNDDTQSVNLGGDAEFTITVTNNGTADLNTVVIEDPEASVCDRTSGQTLSLILGTGNGDSIFNPGESFSYNCTAQNVQLNTFDGDNDADVRANPVGGGLPVEDTDPTAVTVLVASIDIDKNDNDNSDDTQTVMQGGIAEFAITIANDGATDLQNLVVTDNEAPNCALTANETLFILTNGVLGDNPGISVNRSGLFNNDSTFQVGESFRYVCDRANVQLNTFIDNDNDIEVEADPVGGGNSVDEQDETEVLVTPADPSIAIDKDDNDNNDDEQIVNVGGTASFTITVTNDGNVGLQSVVITDVEAPNCRLEVADTLAIIDQDTANYPTDVSNIVSNGNGDTTFDPGESFSYTCDVDNVQTFTFVDGDNDIEVEASVVGLGSTVDAQDDSDVEVLVASIIIDKNDNDNNDDSQTIIAGETAEFSISVTNDGEIALENVEVRETENEAPNCALTQLEVAYILTNGGIGTTDPSGHLISFDRSGLANTDAILQVGETFSYVCAEAGVTATTFNDNDNDIDVTGDPVGGGTEAMDLDDTTVVVITANPSINIDKDDDDNNDDTQTVLAGGTASFTITVTNNGNLDLNQVRVEDPEAPACERDSTATEMLIEGVGNGDEIFNPGESFTYDCEATNVQSGTFADGDNDSTVKAFPVVGGAEVDDEDPSEVVVQAASIEIDKDDDDNNDDTQTVLAGGTASFTITVTNNGTADLNQVRVEDPEAPACERDSAATASLIGFIGNGDNIFNPGESFTYDCEATNVQSGTFADGDNDSTVKAFPVVGGAEVDDEDPSEVVVQAASIEIDKDDDDNNDDTQTVLAGGTASFTITVTNNGTADLNQVRIEDPEAPACERDSAATEMLIEGVGNGDEIFNPGESFTYDCEATNVQSGTFADGDNDSTVKAFPVVGGAEVDDEDPSEVVVQAASIEIDKDDNDNNDDTQAIIEGDTAEFTVVVTNNGTADLDQLNISDLEAPRCDLGIADTLAIIDQDTANYPTNVSNIVSNGNGDAIFEPGESFSYVCSIDNVLTTTFVDNDNDISINARVIVDNSSVDDLDDSEVLVMGAEPAIEIIKDDNDNNDDTQTVVSGGTAEFTITVENTGNRDLNQVVISDVEAPECNRTDVETQVLIAAVGSDSILNPGESFSYTCKADNVTSATFADGDNDVEVEANVIFNNTSIDDQDPSEVVVQAPGIDIDKNDADNSDDTQSVVNGQEATFTITVSNNGSSNLYNVAVSDDETPSCALTTDNTIYILTNGLNGAENTDITVTSRVSNNDAIFEPNESFTYTCSTVGLGSLTFIDGDNDATVSALVVLDDSPVGDTDPSTVVFLNGTIEIDKDDADNSDDTQNVNIGGTANFTITVSNNGTAGIDGVFVTDSEGPNCALSMANVEYILTAGASGTENTVITNVNTNTTNNDAVLDPSESFDYQCSQDNVQTTTFTNNQNLAEVFGETVVGNTPVTDDDTTNIVVIDNQVGEIEITKSSDPVSGTQVTRGSTITYTLTVENVGVLDLTDVEITDQLDTHVTFDPDTQTGIDHTVGTVTIAVGDLAVGETQSFDFTVLVNSDATGTIRNTGSVSGTDTNNNPVNDTSNEVTHTLPGGGGGGGGSAPVITAIPVCLEHPITGNLQITEVRPDRYGPNWGFYQDCVKDPSISEAACVYEWAAYTEYLFPYENGLCVPPATPFKPTPFVGTQCVDAFACPGCLKEDGEPVIEKHVIDPANGTPVDLVAVPVGDEVTYQIRVDLIPLDLNDGFRFIDGTIRVYDYTVSEESGKLWYRDGLVSGWTQHGDAAAGGIYFEREVTTDDYNQGYVELSYIMDTELMSETDDLDQVVNNAFAILRYHYEQEVEDAQGVKWLTEFNKTLGLNTEVCADSHFELSALYDEIATYGDKATVKIIRPFIQGQGGDIAMTDKVAGNSEKVIDDANAGRVITTQDTFDNQTDDNQFVDQANNFANIDNLVDYYAYLMSTATPLDTGASLGQGTNNGLLVVDNGFTLEGTYTFTEPTTLIVRGGSVDITGDVIVDGENFFGVVVLDGAINISDEVTQLQGAYIAEDLDGSGDDGDFKELEIVNKEHQLEVDGMLAGNVNDLLENRRYIGSDPEHPEPNIKLNFDIRMLDSTPPGLEQALGTDWGQVE